MNIEVKEPTELQEVVTEVDVRTKINVHLGERGVSRTWLAGKIGCSKSHLSNILRLFKPLTEEMKVKIEQALETQF